MNTAVYTVYKKSFTSSLCLLNDTNHTYQRKKIGRQDLAIMTKK